MSAGLVVLPSILAPMAVSDVSWYVDEEPVPPEVCAETSFFVPRYLGRRENASLTASMPRLEVMQLLTIGYDYALGHVPEGVLMCNAQGVHEGSTAELALGLAIASMRRIDASARDMVSGIWDHRRGASLQGSHVVVIGAGPVGALVAERFRPMCGQVTMVARTARDDIRAVAELPAILPTADVVVLAVPLTGETTSMVDSVFLQAMKAGSLLVNVARGPVVDTAALVEELARGRISAALDVTDPEPLPADHPLWACPNLLITPHVGGDSDAFPVLARALITRQIEAWRDGRELVNVIARGGEILAN